MSTKVVKDLIKLNHNLLHIILYIYRTQAIAVF